MATQTETDEPFTAWGESVYTMEPGVNPVAVAAKSLITQRERYSRSSYTNACTQPEPAFYDYEALEEKLRCKKAERSRLLEEEAEMRQRLTSAEAILAAMRGKKRDLSTASMLFDERVKSVWMRSRDRPESCALWEKRRRRSGEDEDREHAEGQESISFAVKDRIMELELLNTQLRKGQVKVECSARSEEAALRATKTELEQAREKLQAIPKRSTDSLRLLREEVAKLEKEKRSLEQANHQKGLKDADLIASYQRHRGYLTTQLNSITDEIGDVKDDQDQWRRRLRVETTRIASIQSQRDDALKDLMVRFGKDAIERAAFSLATCRSGKPLLGDRGGTNGGKEGGNSRGVSLSRVADALRPAFASNELLLTPEAVMEAAQECGIDLAGMDDEDRNNIGLEEFCAVAKCLQGKGSLVCK